MNHFADPDFWRAYAELPLDIRERADKASDLLKRDPTHPSLQLKPAGPFWSARVSLKYRALATRDGDTMVWFWIGPHAEYDRLLLRPR